MKERDIFQNIIGPSQMPLAPRQYMCSVDAEASGLTKYLTEGRSVRLPVLRFLNFFLL